MKIQSRQRRAHFSPRRPSRDSGFTVVELLLVASMIVIVAAIAIPNIATSLEGYRLETAARSIAGRLSDARFEAIKRNTPTRLWFDAATGSYQVRTVAGVTLTPAEPLPAGIAFGAATPAQIDFDPIGRVTPLPPVTGVTVQLRATRSGQLKALNVSASGGVRVQ